MYIVCRGSDQDGTELWSEQFHHMVTFSKLLGLLVHLQVLNGLLWAFLARVCWNWESKTVRLFTEVFGRIQGTCRIKPSEVIKAQILFYLGPLGVLFQSFKLEDKDLSGTEDLWILCLRKLCFSGSRKRKAAFLLWRCSLTLFCSKGALWHLKVKEAENFSLCWCCRSKKDNLLSF